MNTSNPSLISDLVVIRSRIAAYYLPEIFLLGIIGNIMNIIIFTRRRLHENVSSWYFICLSVSQIFFLFYNCLYRIITFGWNNGYDLAGTVTALCKFRAYGYILWLALSRHFLCLISLDRWMKSSRSAWVRQKSSRKYVRWLIYLTFLFWIIISVHGPIGYQSTPNSGCTSMVGGTYQLIYTIHTIIIGIVPFTIMILFCFLTLKNVRRQGRMIEANPVIILTNSNNPRRQRSRTDFQLIRLSIFQSIFFLIFNFVSSSYPLYSLLTINQVKSVEQRAIDSLISDVGLYLVHTYMSLTFFLYTLASSTFRKETIKCLLTIQNIFLQIFQH